MACTSPSAVSAARSICNYCETRFPTDNPPHDMLDLPWFAEKVQKAIDERIGRWRDEVRLARDMIQVGNLVGGIRRLEMLLGES